MSTFTGSWWDLFFVVSLFGFFWIGGAVVRQHALAFVKLLILKEGEVPSVATTLTLMSIFFAYIVTYIVCK